MQENNTLEKYTLDPLALKQSILYLLDMAGFEGEEVLQVVIQAGQITILRKERK